jgi:hypothetical protein
MSAEIHLKRENDRLRREIASLLEKIAVLEVDKLAAPNPLAPALPAASAPEKKYNPFNPCPHDPVFNALRAQHQQKRRSWLDFK